MADEDVYIHHQRVNFRSIQRVSWLMVAVFAVSVHTGCSETLQVRENPDERNEKVINPGENLFNDEKNADDIGHHHVTVTEKDLYRDGNGSTTVPYYPVNTTTTTIPFVTLGSSLCFRILEDFGEASSRFTHCMVVYARPFRFCEECVHQYLSVKKYYDDILHDECGEALLKQDRIIIVQQTYDFAVYMWNTANCDGCFRSSNGTLSYESISRDATQFQILLNETTQCFANHSVDYVPRMFGLEVLSSSEFSSPENNSVCDQCPGLYENLSKFFYNMGKQEEICMDIVDGMNYTQYLWSQKFHCKTPVKNPVLIISLSVLFCILPVFFYIGTKIHTVKRERKLVKQANMQDFTSTSRD